MLEINLKILEKNWLRLLGPLKKRTLTSLQESLVMVLGPIKIDYLTVY